MFQQYIKIIHLIIGHLNSAYRILNGRRKNLKNISLMAVYQKVKKLCVKTLICLINFNKRKLRTIDEL